MDYLRSFRISYTIVMVHLLVVVVFPSLIISPLIFNSYIEIEVSDVLLSLVFSSPWILYVIFIWQYLEEDHDKKIFIANDLMTIKKGNEKYVFKKNDVEDLFLVRGDRPVKTIFGLLTYLVIVVNGNHHITTCFFEDYQEIKDFFDLLPRTVSVNFPNLSSKKIKKLRHAAFTPPGKGDKESKLERLKFRATSDAFAIEEKEKELQSKSSESLKKHLENDTLSPYERQAIENVLMKRDI